MKTFHNISFLVIILFITFFSITITGRDTITPTQPLADNETLVSSGGDFALGFFTPADSSNRYIGLWYKKIAEQTPTILWVANREHPVSTSTGIMSIDTEGVLTISDKNSMVVWSTNTTGLDSPVAQLLDSGNFVLKSDGDSGGNYAWEGFDYPTDTMLPGMKIGVDLMTGLNRTLSSWKSDSDPSPGSYYFFMEIRGDPELFICSGSDNKIWRSGAWNGVGFGITREPSNSGGLVFRFVSSNKEVTSYYDITNQSIVSKVVLNQSGVVQHRGWLWESSEWYTYLYAPIGPCDNYGLCGPYGACDPNLTQTCDCLLQPPVFAPKNPANWALRQRSDGCIRKTPLDCKNGTDGFVPVSVKLPDSTNTMVDMSLSLDQCRKMCLKNCSCTAYASANISGGGSGCIIWISELVDIRVFYDLGQDLYVRLPAADIASYNQSRMRKPKMVAIIASVLSGTLVVACIGGFLWKRKKRRRDPPPFDFGELQDFPSFSVGTIEEATDHFSDRNKLGEGGFGPVYKGKLDEDQEIAVKRLATSSQQGIEEFKNEVMLIAKLQNINLVRLLGCCVQREERMLIYEYMPNKSLDTFLFDEEKSALLDWQTRYKIIIGISRGLLYLHHDSRYRIIHRDLKASNILLDKEMNPKISDFGMARLFGDNETNYNTRKVVGTFGYMSPEYVMNGIFSLKSDVFSFGVLLLEIISGKRNSGIYAFSPHMNLVSHAWSSWNEETSLDLVDKSMGENFLMNDVLRCIKVGLLCVQNHPEDRPLMSTVITMLASDITSLPQPKQPGFVARMTSFDSNQIAIASMPLLCTSNNLTVSFVGR